MTTALMEDRIAELDSKLDFIVEELAELRRIRLSGEDLVDDLSRVAKDAMEDAAETLGSTALHPQEIGHLVRTVLRDAGLLTEALHQLESAADFVHDAQPLARKLFRQAIASSQDLEKKGYFNAARAGVRIGDALVQSHSAEDLKQVEDSVPQLIGLLRELTRPEVLEALEAIIHGFGRVQATMDVDKSYFAIARDLSTPEARRGVAILVEFLKVVGARSASAAPVQSPTQTNLKG